MVGVGVFVEASSQRVVGVVDAQSVVFKAYQAVEQVPVQAALLAVVPAADLVAAFVVVVVGAGVFAQQVVHQFVALGVLVQRALVLLGFFIQQAPGRVPLLGLQQAVALVADDFAVQVVALVADQFVFVEAHAQQVAAAVGQPADFVAIRAGGGDALVEHVIFVLLYALL